MNYYHFTAMTLDPTATSRYDCHTPLIAPIDVDADRLLAMI